MFAVMMVTIKYKRRNYHNDKYRTNTKGQAIKTKMHTLRTDPKATIKEIILLIQCKPKENYKPMYNTKLYNKHSGEYCQYLELI